MAEYTRFDKVHSFDSFRRLVARVIAALEIEPGELHPYHRGEVPSHDPVTGQKNKAEDIGKPRPGYVRLIVTDEGVTEGQIAAVLDAWNVLPVQSDKATIQADGADTATISLVYEVADDGDTAVDWELFLDGESIETGTSSVNGVTNESLTTYTMTPEPFNTDTPGTYEFEVRRQTGFMTGIVVIEAV